MALKNLIKNATAKTPLIDLNYLTGELVLSGKSIPENSASLYDDVLKWIQEYAEQPNQLTNLRLKIEYFNTSSSMWVARMIKALSSTTRSDATILIHIYFDILEFESLESDEVKETISPIIDIIGTPAVSVGIKVYGVAPDGEIMKEAMVLI